LLIPNILACLSAEERFPRHIRDIAVKIPILVTTLNRLLTLEQQMQEPVKSALEGGIRQEHKL